MPIPKVTSAALLNAINSGAIRGITKTAKPLESIHLYRSSPQPSPTREGVDVRMEKSSSNTSLIYINPNKSLNYLIPSTLPKNKEKAKKIFPIIYPLNFLIP